MEQGRASTGKIDNIMVVRFFNLYLDAQFLIIFIFIFRYMNSLFIVKSAALRNTRAGEKAGSGFDFSVVFQIDGKAEHVRKGFCDMQGSQV